MKNVIKFSIILLLVFNIFSVGALIAQAEEPVKTPTGLLPDKEKEAVPGKACDSSNCGDYSLNDMVSVATKIASFILGIVGSLALLAFVAGGLMMMLSAGNPEWVTRGKQTLIGAVIGLAIVFTSYAIIQLTFISLGIESQKPKSGENPIGTWATSGWFKK